MDDNSLDRFLEVQRFEYGSALEEIRNGEKTSHWIWYIFPQMRGLGHSYYSDFYGISSIDEAMAYLAHPILGTRLREISEALLSHRGKSAEDILGRTDARKVRSCMTLFDMVCPDDIFNQVLLTFYEDSRCNKTLRMLRKDQNISM